MLTTIVRSIQTSTISVNAHSDSISQIAWDPTDENRFATASMDKTLKLWDARTFNKAVQTLNTDALISVAWNVDATKIAVSTRENRLQIIDLRKMVIERQIKFPSPYEELNEVKWSRDGELFFVTTANPTPGGTVEVIHGKTLMIKCMKTLHAHTGTVYTIDVDPTGRYFATGGSDALVNIWDIQELICIRSLSNSEDSARSVNFNHDGKLLVCASDSEICINHVESGEKIFSMKATYPCAVFHPKRNLLAYSSEDSQRTGLVTILEPDSHSHSSSGR